MISISYRFVLIFFVLFLIVGCSQGDSNPMLPDMSAADNEIVGVADSNHYPMGFYAIEIDASDYSVEVVPLRVSGMHVNLTGIMNSTMGVNAAFVPGASVPSEGKFVLDVSIKSPYSAPQFSGFDVKGIFLTPGTLSIGPLIFADPSKGEARLLNADGYSRWWNPTEFTNSGMFGYVKGNLTGTPASALTATVNPYKYFADILAPTSSLAGVVNEPMSNPKGRGIFTAGKTNTRRYEIKFPMNPGPKVIFGYAIDASWKAPSPNPPTKLPDDFPIEANQPEAYRIAVAPKVNTLYYDTESGKGGGLLNLQINVYDWQGQLVSNPAGQVEVVRVFSPDLFSTGQTATLSSNESTVAKYSMELSGIAKATKAGPTLVAVRAASKDGPSYNQGFGPAPNENVSAWQVLDLNVVNPDCSADTNNDFSEALTLNLNEYNTDQLCAPTDYRDFWKLVVPTGHKVSGSVILYCDASPTKFGLYDKNNNLIIESDVTIGSAEIDLTSYNLMPGTYTFRVLTQTSNQSFLYSIYPWVTLENITPSNPKEVTDGDLYFCPNWIEASGDIFVYACANRIWIMSSNPSIGGHSRSTIDVIDNRTCPAIAGSYMYICKAVGGSSQFDLVNLLDIDNPVVTENVLTIPYVVNDIAYFDGNLFVSFNDGTDKINVYDIGTNPYSPDYLSNIVTTGPADWIRFMNNGSGKGIFYRASESKIEYYVINNISSPFGPGSFTVGGGAKFVDYKIVDSLVYYVVEDTMNVDTLNIKQYAGENLAFNAKGYIAFPYDVNAITVTGGFVSSVGNDGYLTVMNATDPDNPVEKGTWSFTNNLFAGERVNDSTSAFIGGVFGASYEIVELPTGQPYYGGVKVGMTNPISPVFAGNALYVYQQNFGLIQIQAFDFNNPESPYYLGQRIGNFDFADMDVKDSRLAAVTYTPNLELFDINYPGNLTYINSIPLTDWPAKIAMNQTNIYFTLYDNTLRTYDVTMWPVVSEVDVDILPKTGNRLIINGNALYVLSEFNVQVYSIPNSTTTTFVKTYIPQTNGRDLTVYGNTLYIACHDRLEIADITNPLNPQFVAVINYPDSQKGENIAVSEQFVYVDPISFGKPMIFNVSDPSSPSFLGYMYNTDLLVSRIAVKNGYYYEITNDYAFRIWDLY